MIGWHLIWFSLRINYPGLISTSSPTLKKPHIIDPPTTPPFNDSALSPGLLTSKDLMIIILGGMLNYLYGTGKYSQIYWIIHSILYFNCADIGIIGAFSAIVPLTNYLISSKFLLAALDIIWRNTFSSLKMISTLFCTMMTYVNFMMTKATRCSFVYGCGHVILDATSNNAQSMIDAPVSIVDIKISCPGQSTKDTCLMRFIISSQVGHFGLSSLSLP